MNLTTDRETEITQTETQREKTLNRIFKCYGITSNNANMCVTGSVKRGERKKQNIHVKR